jgi:hypothetical protein
VDRFLNRNAGGGACMLSSCDSTFDRVSNKQLLAISCLDSLTPEGVFLYTFPLLSCLVLSHLVCLVFLIIMLFVCLVVVIRPYILSLDIDFQNLRMAFSLFPFSLYILNQTRKTV